MRSRSWVSYAAKSSATWEAGIGGIYRHAGLPLPLPRAGVACEAIASRRERPASKSVFSWKKIGIGCVGSIVRATAPDYLARLDQAARRNPAKEKGPMEGSFVWAVSSSQRKPSRKRVTSESEAAALQPGTGAPARREKRVALTASSQA
jgi:hypothetical protein